MAHSGWFDRNNFRTNEEYTIKVLDRFDIKKYHFESDGYGGLALIINLGLNTYKINISRDYSSLEIYKRLIKRTGQKHPKEYLRLINIDRDGIYSSIKWIKNDSVKL